MTEQGSPRKRRERVTRRSVRTADRLSRVFITAGGIGTILAVLLVCVFLVWVVVPLFEAPTIDEEPRQVALDAATPAPITHLRLDEEQDLAWALLADGTVRFLRLDDGSLIWEQQPFDGEVPTAVRLPIRPKRPGSLNDEEEDFGGRAAFGFADGQIRIAEIGFQVRILEDYEVTDEWIGLPQGELRAYEDGMLRKTPAGQLQLTELRIEVFEPVDLGATTPIRQLDLTGIPKGYALSAIADDGILRVGSLRERRNLMTEEVEFRTRSGEVPVEATTRLGVPQQLLLSGVGDMVFLVWSDGSLLRFDARDVRHPVQAEALDLIPEAGVELTAAAFVLGKTTLVAGDSKGRVRAWFPIKDENSNTVDRTVTKMGHELLAGDSPVTTFAPSSRTRVLGAGFENGDVRLYHVTSEQLLGEARLPSGQPVGNLALAPKDDGVIVAGADGLTRWAFDPMHPEITFAVLVEPIWYEAYPEPQHVWESSSGSDDFEEKFGLVPLIFGTLKATFYSMLFAIPLALLAAIYTSEFLHPKVKARVKPTIEVMASLPSVVLGFLAALVFAPFVEDVVPAVLTAFLTVPFVLLFAAYLWQWIDKPRRMALSRYRFLFASIVLPFGFLSAWALGPVVESALFAGDVKGWLDGRIGSGTGGWVFLLLPVAMFLTAILKGVFVTPRMRRRALEWSEARLARVTLLNFVLAAAFSLAVAFVLATLISDGLGWDPRGAIVDTYVQRNALIVGFVMGFAVIPIIYTIAEDALNSVPEHLRAASLGAGATQWQTAMRVILPTAASGLFSATMIGLGRAVGETMIVLMATGNTAVLEWNIFNGFRTLSANIAVELPEAVKDSTHYRTLFLAALTLFVMTFLLNTLAEVVRQRFRKRAFEL